MSGAAHTLTSEAWMITLDYQKLADTPVGTDPFPHLVVPGFVPPESLRAVLSALPPLSKRGSFPPDSVRLGPAARDLIRQLEDERLRELIAERFRVDLAGAPTMLTLRGWTSERDGRIHCDSTAKVVTVLLYLNQETEAFEGREGCLRLLRGPEDLENYAVEVPPVNGTLLVFPNNASAWHGHHRFVGQRYSIQLNYMTSDGKARSELRRHRLSAFVKRLTMAA
jgi:SM-20-related protein